MRTNRIIGQTGLNLADYVDVKGVEITVVLENSSPEQPPQISSITSPIKKPPEAMTNTEN